MEAGARRRRNTARPLDTGCQRSAAAANPDEIPHTSQRVSGLGAASVTGLCFISSTSRQAVSQLASARPNCVKEGGRPGDEMQSD